jgi:hypothetical protein
LGVLLRGILMGGRNTAEVIAIETDRDTRLGVPEREVERHDVAARVARIEGYLYGLGRANVARALARKRSLENIKYRRAAHAQDVARVLDRNRKRILENVR